MTYPPGDIILQEGDPLDVYCSVNLTHPKAVGYNASHLEFVVRKHSIPEELIHREIVNETTIHMRVKKMNASIVYVDCIVRKEDGSSVQVCQNHVEVGCKSLLFRLTIHLSFFRLLFHLVHCDARRLLWKSLCKVGGNMNALRS